MAGRRIIYLIALIGCLVYYWANREWLSWILLVLVAVLPWLSLLLSLPMMRKAKIRIWAPHNVALGQKAKAKLICHNDQSIPILKGFLLVTESLTDKKTKKRSGEELPTEHCTVLKIDPQKVRVCDYLGLFSVRPRNTEAHFLLVRPVPVRVENPPDTSRHLAYAFKPKPGGGFAENHELRLYRPGDNLNQVHWKLSAKTGKLILREAMEPLQGKALLTMELSGNPDEIDNKLGRLLWMSDYLLKQGISHQIQCFTGQGMKSYRISDQSETIAAIDALLCSSVTAESAPMETYMDASWHYHIGGAADEA